MGNKWNVGAQSAVMVTGSYNMTDDQRLVIEGLRAELAKDIQLGIANFKVWLFAGLLSNALIVGVPSLLAFVSVQSDASEALQVARDNAERLDGRSDFMVGSQRQIEHIEEFLEQQYGYRPMDEQVSVPR